MAKKTEKTTHICSECIGEFDGKDLFEVLVESKLGPTCNYYTNFCEKCIKKLNYTDYVPFHKSRVKAIKEKDTTKTKNDTTEKTKKATTAKAKKSTTTKAKKSTEKKK
jgi:hypothetical protein